MAKGTSDFAFYDPAVGACDGLFTPKRSKGQSLYDVGRIWDYGVISFKGEQMTAQHQSVLLAICAQTARDGLIIRGNEAEVQRHEGVLKLDGMLEDPDMSFLMVSAYDLLLDANMGTGGKDYKALISILHEMSTVSLYREVSGKPKRISPLIAFPIAFKGDLLPIRLNWRLAGSIFGQQNIRVSLNERRELRTPIARLAHCWLSCFIREGQSLMAGKGAKVQTLAKHVWGNRPASDSVWRNRCLAFKRAMVQEIGTLDGWAVTETRNRHGMLNVSRPRQMPRTNDSYFPTPSENADFMDSIHEGRTSPRLYFKEEVKKIVRKK